jgi:hypothetical protein
MRTLCALVLAGLLGTLSLQAEKKTIVPPEFAGASAP